MNWKDLKEVAAANVYRDRRRVGTIRRTRQGSSFEYDAEYLAKAPTEGGIAFHLPFRQRTFATVGINLHSYFAGLLPEGVRIRALTRKVKTSEDDLLSLLIAAGADCVGDIAVTAGDDPLVDPIPRMDVKNIGDVVFRNLFDESLRYGEQAATESSIPGVQEKISASTISFPIKTAKTNRAYILKLNPPDKDRLVENEEFFLRMAKACGLQTAKASLVRDKEGNAGLLVERFDRKPTKGGNPTKIHQEDACQFLDRYPGDKYLIKSSEIAEGIEKWSSSPLVDIARFLRLVAFSYLIGNGDLHAKNVSLHTDPSSDRVSLTPAYDLVCTLPYGDRRMALKFEGKDDNLKAENFVAFGTRFGVNEVATRALLSELCGKANEWVGRLGEIGLTEKKTRDVEAVMKKRRADLTV